MSLDVVCWLVLARLAPTPAARAIVHLFMAAQLVVFLWLIGGRIFGGGYDRVLSKFVST